MKTLIATLFLLTLLLSACGGGEAGEPPAIPAMAYAPHDAPPAPAPTDFARLTLKIDLHNHTPAKFEPPEGAFIGAYIVRDRAAPGIRAFEAALGAPHAIYAYSLTLGAAYPTRWVLENIAAMRTPLITVHIGDGGLCLDAVSIFARAAGTLNVPTFINLAPLLPNNSFLPSEYRQFFANAHEIFRSYAPNVALVWTMDASQLLTAPQFYPGRNYVDWIGLQLYNDISASGEFRDLFHYIELFNFTFQQERPLMLFTAISHYTMENNAYFVHEAAAKIYQTFERLRHFPRIFAIIYHNYDGLRHPRPGAAFANNYLINTAEPIRAAYLAAIAHPHFAPQPAHTDPHPITTRLRSPFSAIMRDGFFYIPRLALVYDLRLANMDKLDGHAVFIDGRAYYSLSDLNDIFGKDFFVSPQNQMLVLR